MSRRRTSRRIATWALLPVALLFASACGGNDAEKKASGSAGRADAAPGAELPPSGTARVDYANGRVSVVSNNAPRRAILEQLAEQADFELLLGRFAPRSLTLRIEDAEVPQALFAILSGVIYSIDVELDETTGRQEITWLSVGEPVSVAKPVDIAELVKIAAAVDVAAAALPQYPDPQPREPAEGRSESALELVKKIAAMSPEERFRLRERTFARQEAEEPELLERLDDPDPRERLDAVEHLPVHGEGRVGEERVARVGSFLKNDPNPEVRRAAAERLGEVETPEAVNYLAAALQDPDRSVVLAAITALEHIDDPNAIPYIQPLLGNSDPEIHDAAEFAIDYISLR